MRHVGQAEALDAFFRSVDDVHRVTAQDEVEQGRGRRIGAVWPAAWRAIWPAAWPAAWPADRIGPGELPGQVDALAVLPCPWNGGPWSAAAAAGTRKNFQLDLFDPDDGHYECSAIVTNKAVTGRTLRFFLCGRGTHEKVYGELKNGFAFDCIPTQRYYANSAWQVLSVIAFNLMRGLQATTAERRRTNFKRRTVRVFETIQTLRYRFINRAGLLVQPNGRATLDVGDNAMVRERFQAIGQALAA